MSPIVAALWITLIGMGLVFIALLVLWAIMALMARIKDGKEPTAEAVVSDDIPTLADTPPVTVETTARDSERRQAAALAVAVALAMRQARQRLQITGRGGEQSSTWQAVMRANRISQRNQIYSRK